MPDFVSIIMTHFASNTERSELMKKSVNSLLESLDYPSELIVVDNGESHEDSMFLLNLCQQKKINVYTRNSNNMHFGFARNQGIFLSHGNYICVIDNDLIYQKGWLSQCIELLRVFPNTKIYSTPLSYPRGSRYTKGELEYRGKNFKLNTRAGSNCFVIRRKDLDEIGYFSNHRIAGSKWTDVATRKGYAAAILPEILVEDEGIRKGYNLKAVIPITLTLSDGQEVNYNQDIPHVRCG